MGGPNTCRNVIRCPQAPLLGILKEHSSERDLSPLLRHRCTQEQCHGMRAAACGRAAGGNQETEISNLHPRPDAVARVAEELPGDGDCDGIDGAVLATLVE